MNVEVGCSLTCDRLPGNSHFENTTEEGWKQGPVHYLLILNKLVDYNDTWMIKRDG